MSYFLAGVLVWASTFVIVTIVLAYLLGLFFSAGVPYWPLAIVAAIAATIASRGLFRKARQSDD